MKTGRRTFIKGVLGILAVPGTVITKLVKPKPALEVPWVRIHTKMSWRNDELKSEIAGLPSDGTAGYRKGAVVHIDKGVNFLGEYNTDMGEFTLTQIAGPKVHNAPRSINLG